MGVPQLPFQFKPSLEEVGGAEVGGLVVVVL
jgi:hypothetical protein